MSFGVGVGVCRWIASPSQVLDLGIDILSQVIYHIAGTTSGHTKRMNRITRVCRVLKTACEHPLLWQRLVVGTWRHKLSSPGAGTAKSDWRKCYLQVQQSTRQRAKGWNCAFFHHEQEAALWQDEISCFLQAVGPVALQEEFLCTYPLHKQLRGEYLGAAASAELRTACIRRLPLADTDIVGALQLLFARMSTRTSMALDRLVMALSAEYHEASMQHLATPNAVHTIMYAALMLNTDMHSCNVRYSEKMTRGSFVQSVLRMREADEAFVPIPVIERIFNQLELDGPFRIEANDDTPTDYSIPKMVCATISPTCDTGEHRTDRCAIC